MDIIYNKPYKYKELQELFNLDSSVSGKQALKIIGNEYKIAKIKYGTYVIERELTLQEKLENKTYNKHRQYIEPMIYAMLSNVKDNTVTMDMHELMVNVELVNKDFNYIKWHTKECADIMQQDKTGLELFTKESEPMLKRIIRDVLYEMQDRQLIKVNEIPVLAYKIYDVETKSWYTQIKDILKVDEIQELLEIKRTILKDMGIVKESDLGYYERSKFRDLIAKQYNASYFYYKYNIILNKVGLQDIDINISELKRSFNDYIQNKLRKSKYGDLKYLTTEEKDIYIKYCIDTKQDYCLRYK